MSAGTRRPYSNTRVRYRGIRSGTDRTRFRFYDCPSVSLPPSSAKRFPVLSPRSEYEPGDPSVRHPTGHVDDVRVSPYSTPLKLKPTCVPRKLRRVYFRPTRAVSISAPIVPRIFRTLIFSPTRVRPTASFYGLPATIVGIWPPTPSPVIHIRSAVVFVFGPTTLIVASPYK